MAKADATAWLAAEETKLRTGRTSVDPQRSKVRFADFAREWMGTRRLRDRTREVYASQLRVHILPEFGAAALAGITPEGVRRWNAQLAQQEPAMAPKSYRQLRTMLGTAVDDGLLAENPCRVRGGGQERATERKIPTIAQVEAVANAITPRLRLAVLLAAYCGLRKSECFGLDRKHFAVGVDQPFVIVERQRIEVAGRALCVEGGGDEAVAEALAG